MSNIKIVYDFEIKQETEVDKIETKVEGEGENAKSIAITTKVKEQRPLYFAIKRPNGREKEECAIVRDVAFKYFVDRGVMTEGNLRKLYGDNGGVYTNEEETHYSNLRERLRILIGEYQKLVTDDVSDLQIKTSGIFAEIFQIRKQIINFERTAAIFYERTAESKAEKKAIEHYFVHLTYVRKDVAADQPIVWEHYFKGKNTEEKLKELAQLEDNDDLTYLKIRDRIILALTLLLNSPNITKEQIKEQEEEEGL